MLRSSCATLALSALLLAAPALAHGEGPKAIVITEEGCVLSAPPCLLSPAGSSVEAGATTVVRFTNDLDETRQVMVHLDEGDAPGALLAGATPVAPGESVDLSVDVPADAEGVWFMAAGGEQDIVLFGQAVSDSHGAEGEDSPGPGLVVLLAVVAVAALLRRS